VLGRWFFMLRDKEPPPPVQPVVAQPVAPPPVKDAGVQPDAAKPEPEKVAEAPKKKKKKNSSARRPPPPPADDGMIDTGGGGSNIGVLIIDAPGGSAISVDGKPRGRAPIGPLNLPAGAHKVVVTQSGTGVQYRRSVKVRAGLDLTMSVYFHNE